MTRSTGRLVSLLVLALVIVAVGCTGGGGEGAAPGPVTQARGSALEIDLRTVKAAVDAYVLQSGDIPTIDGKLPPVNGYALIDFHASFTDNGKTASLYPDFVLELPKHSDEGVWRIDSAMQVSVAMASRDY